MVCAVLVQACNSAPPLAHAFGSADELAAAVLKAVTDADRARLLELSVSEQEFRDHVWPDLPASRPERNLPFSYVWSDLRQKSDAGLTDTLARYRGTSLRLKRVTFERVTPYASYRVHRAATFEVEDGRTVTTARLCGSFLEKDGVWKVFSYVVDD